jgi:hypothetical protein
MYKLTKNANGEQNGVIRLLDGACIPFDIQNTDYIAYLEWCKTNTPLPAEEQA